MSSLDYQGESFRQGVERLKLLGKHAELVMRSYYGEPIDELAQGKSIERLLGARIFSHVDENTGPKLGEPARQLIAQLIADERRRKVNPEIGDFLEEIRRLANEINQAQQQGNHSHADYLFGGLSQDVDDLNSRIINGLESLWNRLNSDFAFVSSLPEKMTENEKAGKEVERWLEGLKMIDFAELINLCGSNARLRNLLVRELQDQVSEHFNRLREVQQRLIELLARFRQQHARNRLVRGMLAHLQRHPNFKPGDYAQRTEVPPLFNQARALQAAASVSLDRLQDGDVLRELLQALPPAPRPRAIPAEAVGAVSHVEHEVVLARRRALQQDVEAFFLQVWQQQQAQSALDWLQESKLEWDAEIWLYQVIAAYQGLAAADKAMFRLLYSEAPASAANQLLVVSDLELRPVAV